PDPRLLLLRLHARRYSRGRDDSGANCSRDEGWPLRLRAKEPGGRVLPGRGSKDRHRGATAAMTTSVAIQESTMPMPRPTRPRAIELAACRPKRRRASATPIAAAP